VLTPSGRPPGISRAVVVAPARLGAGGLGRAAGEFTDGLAAMGVETSFVGWQRPGPLARAVSSRPARRLLGSAPLRRAEARAVRRAVPSTGWDLAYAIAGSVPRGRRGGVRVIHQSTRHPRLEWEALRRAEKETGGRGDMTRPERRRREREIREADLIHVTTHAVRDEFLDAGVGPERLVHAYLGVDLERFSPTPKPDDLRIAFVGPLSMRKGVEVVAELAERARGMAKVITVGGATCPWSRRVVERARFDRRTSVEELLAEARVLVLPSRSDAFAYVVLEALASGTVPIVTPEVGAAEIVRRLDERLVVPRRDFAEEVAALLPGLDLDELARRAAELVLEFDVRETGRHAAAAVLEAAARLRD
jgi:glycosyltransferase involved in cell wall biosynthesis